MIFTATTTATRAQTTPSTKQQQPRFLTSRASVSFSSFSSSLLSKSSKGGRQQPRGHRRRSLPQRRANEGAKTVVRGVVVAGRFPDERTYIMIKCVVVVFRLSS